MLSCITETQTLNDEEKEDVKLAREIVEKVADSIGLAKTITVVACPGAEKLYSHTSTGEGDIKAGDYIVFDPDWLREVAGNGQTELVALLGHEIGHIINADFSPSRKDLDQKKLEGDADYFAGCAVARQGGQWTDLNNVIKRIRRKRSKRYPDRLVSDQLARKGFDKCGGSSNMASSNSADCPAKGYCGMLNASNSFNNFGGTVKENTINIGSPPK